MYTLTLYTAAATETEAAGAALAARMLTDESLPPFVALYGDLGVGKTAFVRGFASVVAPGVLVRSPTFALVNEYRGKEKHLFHFDMYRITDEDDLYSIGYDDYLARDGICLVEWSENIPYALPPHHLRVEIEKNDPAMPDSRRITIEERS
ncbi:MAG: tRNA (adenosine(37)-N6)-threonylcarbamoyltransferase complex ATPase subunit type 1 TsaE [Clostridia bacterium]|nr:tRNA (adenosine(37)-N6)-threonylcarbamoyltransferase complex ATPase subunit type 1 TsaE [Clostridia bacterium]